MIVSMSPLCSNVDTAETHSWWAVSPNRLHVRHTKGTVRRKEEEKERKKGGGGVSGLNWFAQSSTTQCGCCCHKTIQTVQGNSHGKWVVDRTQVGGKLAQSALAWGCVVPCCAKGLVLAAICSLCLSREPCQHLLHLRSTHAVDACSCPSPSSSLSSSPFLSLCA